MSLSKIALWVTGIVVGVMSAIIVLISFGVHEHHFENYEELIGFEGRDIMFNMWYPRTMPRSTKDIYLKYVTDTDHSWSRSTCDREDMKSILSSLKQVTVEEVLNDSLQHLYDGANEEWWPNELSEERIREGASEYRVFELVEENRVPRGRIVTVFYLFLRKDRCTIYHWSPGGEGILEDGVGGV